MKVRFGLLVPFVGFLFMTQFGLCLPGPGTPSTPTGADSQLSSEALVGTWRSPLPKPGGYEELVLEQNGAARHTVHPGNRSRPNTISAGSMPAAICNDIVDTGRWRLSSGVIELMLSVEDPAHPILLKGLRMVNGRLKVSSNCVWLADNVVCFSKVQTYSRVAGNADSPQTQKAAPTSQQPVLTVGSLVPLMRVVKSVNPIYPTEALANGIEGVVCSDLVVSEDGKVESARVFWSSNDIFNEPALVAVSQWQFTPPIAKDGKPSKAHWIQGIVFRAKNSGTGKNKPSN